MTLFESLVSLCKSLPALAFFIMDKRVIKLKCSVQNLLNDRSMRRMIDIFSVACLLSGTGQILTKSGLFYTRQAGQKVS